MNSLERDILSAFDRAGAKDRALSGLGPELVVLSNMRELAARLVENGWLRPGATPDTVARTEDGRLQLAGPLDLTIYSRPGCHLCEEAKSQIAPILQEFGASLIEINIDADPLLRSRYDYDVPVILLGTRKIAKHRVDMKQLRRQLQDASR